jgi:hypothetical protein
MSAKFGVAAVSLILTLAVGGCAHRTAAATSPSGANDAPAADGDVPSKRRGVIVPSDPKLGISGAQPPSATGTEGGRIDGSLGKGASGASPP